MPALAQESPYSVPLDSASKGRKYIPTGIRLGVDILGPTLYLFDDRINSYEFTLETDLSIYNLIAEAGHNDYREENDNVKYYMTGDFLRVGADVNFLGADKGLNSFFFGLRYAWAQFDETLDGVITEDNWGDLPLSFSINDNKSQWLEMTTGVKVRLWKGLFTGYIFRFRFARSGSVPDLPFEPYYVPGYGLADRSSTWGFRYYVLYRLQWSKKPVKVKQPK